MPIITSESTRFFGHPRLMKPTFSSAGLSKKQYFRGVEPLQLSLDQACNLIILTSRDGGPCAWGTALAVADSSAAFGFGMTKEARSAAE